MDFEERWDIEMRKKKVLERDEIVFEDVDEVENGIKMLDLVAEHNFQWHHGLDGGSNWKCSKLKSHKMMFERGQALVSILQRCKCCENS